MKQLLAYLQITLGTAIGAAAVNLFIVPNHLATGGMSGLILIAHYLWNAPMGVSYFLANLPALIFLFRIHGWRGLIRQIWGIVTFSLFLQVTQGLAVHAPTHNLLLATLYGGGVLGLGMALAMRVGGSTGGSTPYGQVLQHYTGLDIGKFLLISDLVILLLAGVMLSPEAILYGLIVTIAVVKVMQVMEEGFSTSRCLLIITEQPAAVNAAALTMLRRGVTHLHGTGGYSGQDRPVLMCVVAESEVQRLQRLVLEADPTAFVVTMDAREVAGRGFTLDTDARQIPFWATQRGM